MVKDLPESFDWRKKDGTNFVTPVRNQGQCGSCYSFASMGCLEAGCAIETNGRIKPIFSPQYIVSCSNYSQGCDGGEFDFSLIVFVLVCNVNDRLTDPLGAYLIFNVSTYSHWTVI